MPSCYRLKSVSLLDKLKTYSTNDSYPWEITVVSNPAASIEWSNGTKWTIDTAENSNAAVGDTNQLGFFSEVSKWPQTTAKNDAKVMAAVLPTLSGSDTVAIAESTPEGATGWQYENWQTAVTLDEYLRMHAAGIRPEEQWVKVFAAWFEFADYRRRVRVAEPLQGPSQGQDLPARRLQSPERGGRSPSISFSNVEVWKELHTALEITDALVARLPEIPSKIAA